MSPSVNKISVSELQDLVRGMVKEAVDDYRAGRDTYGRGTPVAPDLRTHGERRADFQAKVRRGDKIASVASSGVSDTERDRIRQKQDFELASKRQTVTKTSVDAEEQAYADQKAAKKARMAAYVKAHPLKSLIFGANPPKDFKY